MSVPATPPAGGGPRRVPASVRTVNVSSLNPALAINPALAKGLVVKPRLGPIKLPRGGSAPTPVDLSLDPPDLYGWLEVHSEVANSLKWQVNDGGSVYHVPDSAKKSWTQWSAIEQQELAAYFAQEWVYQFQKKDPHPESYLIYPPLNLAIDIQDDSAYPRVVVDALWARTLYLRWMALQLVTEIGQLVPWSVLNDGPVAHQILFDSAAMVRQGSSSNIFLLGAVVPENPVYLKREDNLGLSLIARPRDTQSFLRANDLIGDTRLDTIHRMLGWCTKNLRHNYEERTYGHFEKHWQYRGLPPITRIIEGTTYKTSKPEIIPFGHWTAGCHGTYGFLRNVLRAVNIPVEGVLIDGHNLVHFLTEGKYMDHGDNPYNLGYKASGLPPSALLIDTATFLQNFGPKQDNNADHPESIGKTVNSL